MKIGILYIRNSYQDTGQGASLSDVLSTSDPLPFLIEEQDESPISTGEPLSKQALQRPLFGSHVREAVEILKDWVKNP